MQSVLPSPGEPRYQAFISYSHSDRQWGEQLHQWLESYRIPERLVGTTSKHGTPVPARLYPVFRDRAELPSSSDLGQEIKTALAGSRTLIVVCSPRSACSEWVEEEIFQFKLLGGEKRTFGLIVDGEPFASENSETPGLECFPRGLRTRIGPDGKWTDQRLEPGAADVRPEGDGKRDAFLKVAAAVAGVGFDALKRRDEARERQRLRRWLAAASVLTILFAALAGLAFWQRGRALRALSRSDGDNALRRLADGDARGALAFLARAVRSDADNLAAKERLGALLVQRRWPVPELTLQDAEADFFVVELSPDGRLVAAKDLDGRLRFWDATTGDAQSHPFPGLPASRPGDPFAFSPDGRLLAVAGEDGIVRVWRSDGKLAWASAGPGEGIHALSFSRDGSRLAAGMARSGVSVWRVREGPESRLTLPHPSEVLAVGFDPSGTRLATGGMDNLARLWDLAAARQIASFDEGDRVAAVELSPDGSQLLTGAGYYGSWTVRLRTLATGQIWTAAHPLPEPAEPIGPSGSGDARFSPDGSRVLSLFSLDRSVRFWNAADGSPAAEPVSHRDLLRAARFSPDGNRIATIAGDGRIRTWLLPPRRADSAGHIGKQVEGAILLPNGLDGAAILSSGGDRWSLAALDLRQKPRIAAERLLPGRAFIEAADARHIAVATAGGAVHIFDATTLEPLAHVGAGALVDAAALSDEALWIGRSDGTVQHVPLDGPGQIRAAKLPDSGHIKALAFDPASQNLLLATELGKVFLWPRGSTSPPGKIGLHDNTASLALLVPGNRMFVTGGYDGQVRRWRSDGKPLAPGIRQSAELVAMAFSPDGRTLVTGARDDTARWWDIETGDPLAAPVRLSSWCTSIVPSPSGESFLIGDQNGTLHLHSRGEALPLADPAEKVGEIVAFGWHGNGTDALAILKNGTIRRLPLRLPVEAERTADLAAVADALSDLRLNEVGGLELKEPASQAELTAILAGLPVRSALPPVLRNPAQNSAKP